MTFMSFMQFKAGIALYNQCVSPYTRNTTRMEGKVNNYYINKAKSSNTKHDANWLGNHADSGQTEGKIQGNV